VKSSDTKRHRGFFPLPVETQPLPQRTLVLEDVPRKYRSEDFVNRWLKQFKKMRSPRLIKLKNDKILIEFHDVVSKRRAFQSPRMRSNDGLAGVRAWNYTPSTPCEALRCTSEATQDSAETSLHSEIHPTTVLIQGSSQIDTDSKPAPSSPSLITNGPTADAGFARSSRSRSPVDGHDFSNVPNANSTSKPLSTPYSHDRNIHLSETDVVSPHLDTTPVINSLMSSASTFESISRECTAGTKRKADELVAGHQDSLDEHLAMSLDINALLASVCSVSKRAKISVSGGDNKLLGTQILDPRLLPPAERIDALISEFKRVHSEHSATTDKSAKLVLRKRLACIDGCVVPTGLPSLLEAH